jgi:glycosyltransferase involved in cell wall biosynthesis
MTRSTAEPANNVPALEAIALGVFPPPVTGMTLCTERVAQALETAGSVRRLNLSSSAAQITWGFRLRKLVRLLIALPQLLIHRRRAQRVVLYMPCNRGLAMFYNVAAAAIAKLRGFPVAVHHHSYAYIRQPVWRLKLLDRMLHPHGVHLLLCPRMAADLQAAYPLRAPCRIIPSTIMLPDDHSSEQASSPRSSFTLGHLSNLTLAKGFDDVLETLRRLHTAGRDVRLLLAGPIAEAKIQQQVSQLCAAFPDRVEYRGPVYGEAKQKFFQEIDAFLFPTRYATEAQPIVLSEAMNYAKPVISYNRVCIPQLVGEATEWLAPEGGDFVGLATQLIEAWMDDPAKYAADQAHAQARVEELRRHAQQSLAGFVAWAAEGNLNHLSTT